MVSVVLQTHPAYWGILSTIAWQHCAQTWRFSGWFEKISPWCQHILCLGNPTKPFPSPELSVCTPVEWLEYFVDAGRLCSDGNHESCDCAQHFLDMMGYVSVECELIEKETRGQNQNRNWHNMRVGLITASNVKKVMCSTNEDKTAEVLLTGSSLNEENLPASIKFGRTREKTALGLFCRAHQISA